MGNSLHAHSNAYWFTCEVFTIAVLTSAKLEHIDKL
jgi:hypothetical protein